MILYIIIKSAADMNYPWHFFYVSYSGETTVTL